MRYQPTILGSASAICAALLLFCLSTQSARGQDAENLDAELEALLLDDLKNSLPADAVKDESEPGSPERPTDEPAKPPAGEDIGQAGENLAPFRIGRSLLVLDGRPF